MVAGSCLYSNISLVRVGGSDGKESPCNAEDPGVNPGSGRSPGVGNENPLQYSCLENSMDRGAWWATVHGVIKSQTRLSDTHTHTHTSSNRTPVVIVSQWGNIVHSWVSGNSLR